MTGFERGVLSEVSEFNSRAMGPNVSVQLPSLPTWVGESPVHWAWKGLIL